MDLSPPTLYALGQHFNIIKDYQSARDYFERALAQGNFEAAVALGTLHFFGRGGPPNNIKARELYELAITKLASPLAFGNLGVIHFRGEGTPIDYHKAKDYFERSVALGSSEPLPYLGCIHYDGGHGVEIDYELARQYFERADNAGKTVILKYLGMIYYRGFGVPKDYERARIYFERARAVGDNFSLPALGRIYRSGYGVPRNIPMALSLYLEYFSKIKDEREKQITLRRITTLVIKPDYVETFVRDYIRLFHQNNQLTEEVANLTTQSEELKQQIDLLQEQVDYQPEGPGYLAAKEDFNRLTFGQLVLRQTTPSQTTPSQLTLDPSSSSTENDIPELSSDIIELVHD